MILVRSCLAILLFLSFSLVRPSAEFVETYDTKDIFKISKREYKPTALSAKKVPVFKGHLLTDFSQFILQTSNEVIHSNQSQLIVVVHPSFEQRPRDPPAHS